MTKPPHYQAQAPGPCSRRTVAGPEPEPEPIPLCDGKLLHLIF